MSTVCSKLLKTSWEESEFVFSIDYVVRDFSGHVVVGPRYIVFSRDFSRAPPSVTIFNKTDHVVIASGTEEYKWHTFSGYVLLEFIYKLLNGEATPYVSVPGPLTRGEDRMNMHTAIFLVNDKCRLVSLAYDACDENGIDPSTKVPVKTRLFKTFNTDLKKGDLVLAETTTRHCFSVFRVINPDVEVDLDIGTYIPWIVERVDGSTLERMREMENKLLTTIRAKDKERKRAELAQTMYKDYGEELKKIIDPTSVKTIAG